MTALKDTYTSTGSKFFWHQEAMHGLRAGKPQCVTTHVMLTDVCNHKCAFCSVQHREGDSLRLDDVLAYLGTLKRFGLKSVILSGGGNPILYKDKVTGQNFNDAVSGIHSMGLEIGLITNGMPLKLFGSRESWATVRPETLDRLTWVRVSMSGLDHEEREVFVPDIDPERTTLGMSYVFHDVYKTDADKKHGAVSTRTDLVTLGVDMVKPTWAAMDRVIELTEQISFYVKTYRPRYVRILPNCLEHWLIEERCNVIQKMCDEINRSAGYEAAFVQHKPPNPPDRCYLGYIHPVLNSDGYVLPCDSCCLHEEAGHKLGESWRMCHWSEIEQFYTNPVRSLISDPKKKCPNCVFGTTTRILEGVVDGIADITPPEGPSEHVNFV